MGCSEIWFVCLRANSLQQHSHQAGGRHAIVLGAEIDANAVPHHGQSYRPNVGDHVLFPTTRGAEVAECVWAPSYVSEDIGGLPVCAGVAANSGADANDAAATTPPAPQSVRLAR